MFTNKLTIAIPVYERTDFFDEALNSAINQNIKCQVLVVDNCSSHNKFGTICKRKGIEYHRNASNIGMFPNWNKCFEHSKTDFTLILGDDDVLLPNYVEKFIKALEAYPNIDLFYADFDILNFPSGNINPHRHTLPFGYYNKTTDVIKYGIKYRLGFPVITSSIRNSKFKGFYSAEHGSNDWLWAYSNITDLAVFGEEEILLHRRSHSSNDSGNSITRQKTSLSMAYLFDHISKMQIDSELVKKAQSRSINTLHYFLSIADDALLKDLVRTEFKYASFFKSKLHRNTLLSVYIKLPLVIRRVIYRIFTRIRLIGKF